MKKSLSYANFDDTKNPESLESRLQWKDYLLNLLQQRQIRIK